MIKFRVCVSGKNAQGVAVSKHEQVFTADIKCNESAELAVLNMVAQHIEQLAKDLEQAAADAQLEIQAAARARLTSLALLGVLGGRQDNAKAK